MSETTNPKEAASGNAVTTTKKARARSKHHTAKSVSIMTLHTEQSVRLTDKELLLALFPALEEVFKFFPNLYRLEINHGHASKKYSIWWKPHGRLEEGYDNRTLKQYAQDKTKGIGRIY